MSGASGEDSAVRLQVLRSFVEAGRAPVPAEIAEALELDQASVERSLHRLADAHVLVLAPGSPYIWMANPFSAIPTPFSVEVDGRTLHGNCIWDALGVVVVAGGTGTVRTWCPDCGERLAVSVEGNRLTGAGVGAASGPQGAGDGVVHFAVPAARWWDDIGFT